MCAVCACVSVLVSVCSCVRLWAQQRHRTKTKQKKQEDPDLPKEVVVARFRAGHVGADACGTSHHVATTPQVVTCATFLMTCTHVCRRIRACDRVCAWRVPCVVNGCDAGVVACCALLKHADKSLSCTRTHLVGPVERDQHEEQYETLGYFNGS